MTKITVEVEPNATEIGSAGGWVQPDGTLGYHPDDKITVVAPLTEFESTILQLAATGEYMIPIGIWEAPMKTLRDRGFLEALDSHNYVITEAGLAAINAEVADVDRAVAETLGKAALVHVEVLKSIDVAVQALVEAVQKSVVVTGDHPEDALRKWLSEIRVKVVERLKCGSMSTNKSAFR